MADSGRQTGIRYATQTGTFTQGTNKNSSLGGANIFPDPQAALTAFGNTDAGQVGTRNNVRGDGFTIDTALSKRFKMPYKEQHTFQIRAEAFNLTKTARFDVNQLSLSIGTPERS